MALDITGIRNEFVRVASNFVGDELSTTSKAGQQVPSVMLERNPQNTPDLPYIVFDILSIDDTGSWLLRQGVDDNDNPYYTANVKMLMQYTVYGQDSLRIASKLKNAFRVNRVLGEITTNTCGSIEDVFSISSLPEKLAGKFVEVAGFNLTFNVEDITTDEEGGVITTVDLNGVLTDEGEITTIDMDITISAPS